MNIFWVTAADINLTHMTLFRFQVIWVCILCRKKQELLSKTGQWINKTAVQQDGFIRRIEPDGSSVSRSNSKLKANQVSSFSFPPSLCRTSRSRPLSIHAIRRTSGPSWSARAAPPRRRTCLCSAPAACCVANIRSRSSPRIAASPSLTAAWSP